VLGRSPLDRPAPERPALERSAPDQPRSDFESPPCESVRSRPPSSASHRGLGADDLVPPPGPLLVPRYELSRCEGLPLPRDSSLEELRPRKSPERGPREAEPAGRLVLSELSPSRPVERGELARFDGVRETHREPSASSRAVATRTARAARRSAPSGAPARATAAHAGPGATST